VNDEITADDLLASDRNFIDRNITGARSNVPPGTMTNAESERAGVLFWKGNKRAPEENSEMNVLLGYLNTILSGR
jgi:hypothetical protein